MDANSTPTAPLPMMLIDFGTDGRWIASSLKMIFLRSASMPGTLRGDEPVATMISFRAARDCVAPSCSDTSTPSPPVSRAVPLIQSILFFLKSISMPPVRPETILSFRACTAGMSIDTAAPSMPLKPHSFAACAIFSACACSSNALVGMQPQIRQVPPSVFCFSTTATLRPSCAARIAATYPPVPAPITTTSYSFATIPHCGSPLQLSQGDEGLLRFRSRWRRGIDLRLQLAVLELQPPVHLFEHGQLARRAPRVRIRDHGDDKGGDSNERCGIHDLSTLYFLSCRLPARRCLSSTRKMMPASASRRPCDATTA